MGVLVDLSTTVVGGIQYRHLEESAVSTPAPQPGLVDGSRKGHNVTGRLTGNSMSEQADVRWPYK